MKNTTSSPIKIKRNPSATDAVIFITEHHQKKAEKTCMELIGEYTVDYHGRARSFLDWGERIILVKQDGNVIIHQPVLREPINWQPAGSIIAYTVEKNHFIMHVRHTNPPEKMKIKFRKIYLIIISMIQDTAKIKISGMESDVVNQIVNNPYCIEQGLRIQKREKQVKSGMIDLFGYDKDHTPVIIEVKRSLATISSVHQLRMYVNDIKHDCHEAAVRGILCAPRVPDMVKHLLADYGLEWQEIEREIILPDDHQRSLDDFKINDIKKT